MRFEIDYDKLIQVVRLLVASTLRAHASGRAWHAFAVQLPALFSPPSFAVQDDKGIESLRAFAATEFADENIIFIQRVRRKSRSGLYTLRQSITPAQAHSIWS